MTALLEALHAELDHLNRIDPDTAPGREVQDVMVDLEAVRAKVEALTSAWVGSHDARGLAGLDEAKDTAAVLRVAGRVERSRAARHVRHARALRTLPHTRAALADGAVSSEVVAKLVAADNHRTRDALRRDEADLVAVGERERFDRFCRHIDRWILLNDPDGGHEERPEHRRLHMSQTLGGCWALDGWFDPVRGAVIRAELERLEHDLFERDWGEATRRLGRTPLLEELRRTPAQRRADALVEMATRSRACGAADRRPQPLINVVAGAETFKDMCRLLDGTVVSPAEAAALLDDAVIERITFDGHDRPFAVSEQRCFRGAMRRAILIRDQECTHDMCDEPAGRIEVDHVVPAGEGGPTSITNGRGRCGFHNRLRNRRHRHDGNGREPPGDHAT